jgi:16S rRNA (adenine1518-N6/adenine1519-N6)-dimethyltransferase
MNDDKEQIAKKSLGQHWLTDDDALQAMCDAADLSPDDTVLEIGPGLGALTDLLIRRCHSVIAVEKDEALATALPKKIVSEKLRVVSQDILTFNLNDVPSGYKIVANIPYYLTNNLIRILSITTNAPALAVLLVQKEVAERVTAKPGQMSLLSVTAQFYWETSLGRIVKAESFTPAPKIDSQILVLQRRQQALFPDVDPDAFFIAARAGFAQRRKTLLNSLHAGLHVDKTKLTDALERVSIDPSTRAQALTMEQWHAIYKSLIR